MSRFRVGQAFKLSADALENYGAQHADKTYHVRAVYTHYVPAAKMKSDPTGHPGFDPNGGGPLYGSELPFDLYEWEMVSAPKSKEWMFDHFIPEGESTL